MSHYAPELETLDQLIGGDMSMNMVARLFEDSERCKRAIAAMLADGELLILDESGEPIPEWRFRELKDDLAFWAEGTPYRASITDVGARRFEGPS